MTPQNGLEISGNFVIHPLSEVIAEITQARLNGSLRASNKEKKSIIYFKGGKVVFAVSNSRSSRLFEMLLSRGRINRKDLADVPNFVNDLELAANLQSKGLLSKDDCDRLFVEQITGILVDAVSWEDGNWVFSSLARIRDGLEFPVDTASMLVDYGRCLSTDSVLKRYRSLEETFSRTGASETSVILKPEEAFVLSRSNDGALSAARMSSIAGMSESLALRAIYTLWLGGLLQRDDWQPAISDSSISAMQNARLEMKREAKMPSVTMPEPVKEEALPVEAEPQKKELSVEDYLDRVENAGTYYDMLGVPTNAETAVLKDAYFSLARRFHPDRYHSEGGTLLKRVQHAFTELAQAHETLKNTETREIYDYRMRKELAEKAKRESGTSDSTLKLEQAIENFERGFELLMDGDVDESLPFLGRAVHYDPKNAKFHAYYGKALSNDKASRYKAEAEMQAAVRLDPKNTTYRIMLAEFYIEFNLLKRAEGELKRLLELDPNNHDALDLLARLQ